VRGTGASGAFSIHPAHSAFGSPGGPFYLYFDILFIVYLVEACSYAGVGSSPWHENQSGITCSSGLVTIPGAMEMERSIGYASSRYLGAACPRTGGPFMIPPGCCLPLRGKAFASALEFSGGGAAGRLAGGDGSPPQPINKRQIETDGMSLNMIVPRRNSGWIRQNQAHPAWLGKVVDFPTIGGRQ